MLIVATISICLPSHNLCRHVMMEAQWSSVEQCEEEVGSNDLLLDKLSAHTLALLGLPLQPVMVAVNCEEHVDA